MRSWRKLFVIGTLKDFMSKPCCLCTKRCNQTGNDMRTYESSSKGVTAVARKKKSSIIFLQIPSERSERENFVSFFSKK